MTQTLRTFPPVDEPVEDPGTFRQTRIARFNHCPRSLYLDLKYDGGKGSIAMDRGTALHEVIERCIALMVEGDESTIPGEMATEIADAVMAERLDLVLSTEEQDAVRLMAYNWAEATALDPAEIVGVEVPLEAEVAGRTVTARVDLIEARGSALYIRDWKSSLAIRKKEEVEKGLQGQLYAYLCLFGVHRETKAPIGGGVNEVWFYETYPRYRTDEGPLIAREASWTRPELVEFGRSLERNVRALERSLATGDWPARDGSWCSQCPAQTECPIPAHLREIEEVTTPEQAQDAFSRKLALERESRRVQGAMRGWVQENGSPIYVGDLAFDATVTESKVVKDWDALIQGLYQASEFGTPFEVTEHVEVRRSTKYAKRKQNEEELNARAS